MVEGVDEGVDTPQQGEGRCAYCRRGKPRRVPAADTALEAAAGEEGVDEHADADEEEDDGAELAEGVVLAVSVGGGFGLREVGAADGGEGDAARGEDVDEDLEDEGAFGGVVGCLVGSKRLRISWKSGIGLGEREAHASWMMPESARRRAERPI